MISLVRLFPQFRELEVRLSSAESDVVLARAANEDLIQEKEVLEARLNAALADKEKLWDAMQDALNGERLSYQMQINHAVQKSGGGIPYPNAHSLPPATTRLQEPGAIGRRGRELPSEAAAKSNERFLEAMFRPQEVK